MKKREKSMKIMELEIKKNIANMELQHAYLGEKIARKRQALAELKAIASKRAALDNFEFLHANPVMNKIKEVLNETISRCCIVTISGKASCGKTFAVKNWLKHNRGSYCHCSSNGLIENMEEIALRLKSGDVLIVDNANYLTFNTSEYLRDLHDTKDISIALIGSCFSLSEQFAARVFLKLEIPDDVPTWNCWVSSQQRRQEYGNA